MFIGPSADTKSENDMERRKKARLSANAPVTVTVLAADKTPPVSGRVLDMSGCGLLLSVPRPIPLGTPVKVEGNDILLLGEASRSQQSSDGYHVALELLHSLGALADLDRLNRALIGEEVRVPVTGASQTR